MGSGVCIGLAACCDIAPFQNVILRAFSLALGQAVHTQKMCVHMSRSVLVLRIKPGVPACIAMYPRSFELLP